MFKRLKRIIELSKKDPEILSKLTEEEITSIPEIGDGKAVFFDEGYEKEFEEQEKKDKGLWGIFGIK